MYRRLPTLLLIVTLAAAVSAAESVSKLGQTIPEFRLADYRSKEHSLGDYPDAKLFVVAFLGVECPIVKLYSRRLQAMSERYGKRGVVFWGINSNQQDSLTELEHFARTHGIRFPLLKDPGNRVADLFGAERTPEVYVLDANRVVLYFGRIDDQYHYETQRSKADRNYLMAALDQLLDGQPVATPETESVGCHIGRLAVESTDKGVTYASQISRILQHRCVECHRDGDIAPFALTEYDEVAGWAEMIAEVVRLERMPPWHADPAHGKFAEDRRMSDEEKQLIYQWVADGRPRGSATDLPTSPSFTPGWQLPALPDLVVPMRDKPYTVPAEGEVKYQYFTVDPGFTGDRWVKAAEVLPGNRAVVHHVLVFAQSPKGRRISGEQGGFLAAFVPGLRAKPFPPGMAKRVPARSKLVFQVHYTPVGTEQADLSRLGLIFAEPEQVTHEVKTVSAIEHRFAIPPHVSNHPVEAISPHSPIDVLLLAMMPHMHLRGKSYRYEARYPDGSTEILLDIPRYDFNWQTTYRLTEPKRLPAGTRLHCTAHFDNSAGNLANPDPSKTVRWGDQTWDEMMIGYFDVAVPLATATSTKP